MRNQSTYVQRRPSWRIGNNVNRPSVESAREFANARARKKIYYLNNLVTRTRFDDGVLDGIIDFIMITRWSKCAVRGEGWGRMTASLRLFRATSTARHVLRHLWSWRTVAYLRGNDSGDRRSPWAIFLCTCYVRTSTCTIQTVNSVLEYSPIKNTAWYAAAVT